MSLFLTAAEKRRRLTGWQEYRNTPLPEGELAGRGYPDAAIYSLTDRLNRLLGICTIQSCSGHPETEWEGVYPGSLWLRLSEPVFTAFIQRVDTLVAHLRIEQAAILWGREREGHVVEITFEGLNKGAVELMQASEVIIDFFTDLEKSHGAQSL